MNRLWLLLPLLSLFVLVGCRAESPTRLELAQQAFDENDLDLTVVLSNEMLAAGEEESEAHILLGRVHAERDEHAQAIEHYTAAIELDPEDSRAYWFRSKAWLALEDLERADADHDLSMSLQPDAVTTQQNLESTYETWRDALALEDVAPDNEEDSADEPAETRPDPYAEYETHDEFDPYAELELGSDPLSPEEEATASSLTIPGLGTRGEEPIGPTAPMDDGVVSDLLSGIQAPSALPQDPLSLPSDSAALEPLEGDTLPPAGGDSSYHWNDYLQDVTAGTDAGYGLPATGQGIAVPSTGLTPSQRTPSTGLAPQTGFPSQGGYQPGFPDVTPRGGASTGIISSPSSLPGTAPLTATGPLPATGPLGAARDRGAESGRAAGSGLPGVFPPNAAAPVYGPLGQQPQGPNLNTGNYRLPAATPPTPGTTSPSPRRPTTGLQSGAQP